MRTLRGREGQKLFQGHAVSERQCLLLCRKEGGGCGRDALASVLAVSKAGFGTTSGTALDELRPPGKAPTGPLVLEHSCGLAKVTQARAPSQEPGQREFCPEANSMAQAAYLKKIRR